MFKLVLACLLPFTVIRIAMLGFYQDDFAHLAFDELIKALLYGLKFDASILASFVGLPLLMMSLPFKWSQRLKWQHFWAWMVYLGLALLILMAAVDAIYFGLVHRHIGAEVGAILTETEALIKLAFLEYWLLSLIFLIAMLVGALGWRLLLPAGPFPRFGRIRAGVRFLSLFFIVLIVWRGGVGGKPISVGDAFASSSLSAGYLTLNGAFALSRAVMDRSPSPKIFMPDDVALERVRNFIYGDVGTDFNPNYPLLRAGLKVTQTSAIRSMAPNVIVLMLEGWGAGDIDSYRALKGAKPLGLTPNFDKLAAQGLLFKNFYANGQRSIHGAAAILAGLPTLPGMPFLGEGMEQNKQSFLGELALSQGYETLFLQSSDRASLRLAIVSARAGLSTSLGNEDIPASPERKKPENVWGTWDLNTFLEASRRFSMAQKPFLGFIFSSTTHTPFLIPDSRWERMTGGATKDKYLNSLFYADWALGELIADAKKAGYFENTIFVLTADHASDFVEHTGQVENLFHIPLLITGPGLRPGFDDRLGSQLDLIPTLVDLLGWHVNYAGFGRSLLDKDRPEQRAALTVRNDVMDWITPRGTLSHNLDRRVANSSNLTSPELDEMERNLLAMYQVTAQYQLKNQLMPYLRADMTKNNDKLTTSVKN